MNHAADFARQLDAGAVAKTKAADVFVELLFAQHHRQLGRADVAGMDENILHGQSAVAFVAVIVERPAEDIPDAVLAEDDRVETDLAFVERRRRGDDLEGRARLHQVDDGAVFHLLRFRFRAKIEIKVGSVCHGQDLAGLRPHQDDGRLGRPVFAHGGVELVLDDHLQAHVDREVNLRAVARSAFQSAVEDDFATLRVALDVTITVLPPQIIIHRRLHPLDAFLMEIGKTDDVAEHRPVGINPHRAAFAVNAAQLFRVQSFLEDAGVGIGHLALQDDVTTAAVDLLRHLVRRKL